VYLKRLDIKGFKSFADSTEIYLQPGINIIVGPNGCGKSNIVEAIRWCLGESNVRNLRGHKGEDVIFNGTDDKRAQGMAYVELVIDNEDQLLPFEYSEINIARKLFRSGESEFYVNKSRVRMKDINQQFTGTGLGRKGYSIVSQGELEQVLNGQPLDRRFILEEASGIIKYRRQRDEIIRRITNAGNDLTRVRDILGELKQRKEELAIKADKARVYIEFTGEHRRLEENILRYEIWKMQKDLHKKNDTIQERKEEIEGLKAQVQEQEDIINCEEARIGQLQDDINSLKEEKHSLDTNISSMHSEVRLSEERIKNYSERIRAAGEDEKKYLSMLQKLEEDMLVKLEDYEQQKSIYIDMKNNYEQLNHQILENESSQAKSLQLFEDKKALVFEKIQGESRINNQVVELEEQQRKYRERKERLEIRGSELKEKIQRNRELLDNLEKDKTTCNQEMESFRQNLEQLEGHKQELERLFKENDGKYAQLKEEELRIDKQLLIIDDMERNMEGYSRGVRAVLDLARKGKLSGINGLVGEVLDVPLGLETAIETALGRKLENIIVKNSESARDAIEYLKTNKKGRVTFLPLDILLSTPVPADVKAKISRFDGVLGIASDLIEYEPAYKKAIEYLLGRIVLVKDIDTGIEVFKCTSYPLQIVSLEGELINMSGAMTGGTNDMRKGTPLQRKKEKKQLLQQQCDTKHKLQQNRQEAEQLNAELEQVKNEVDAQKNALIERKFRFEIIDKQAGKTTAEMEHDRQERENIIEQIFHVDDGYEEMTLELNALQQKRIALQGSSEEESAELEKLKESIDIEKREYEVHKERLSSYKEQMYSKNRELLNIEKNMSQFNEVKNSYQQSKQESFKLKERLSDLIESEKANIEETNKKIAVQEDDSSIIKDKILLEQEEKQKCRILIESARGELTPARKVLIQIESSFRNAELSIARLETEFEALCRKWFDEFKKEIKDIGEPDFNSNQVKDFRQRVEFLTGKIEGLGSVDIDSIQEFDAVQDRYEFINKQYEDLLTARDSLNELLQETEKIMSKDFVDFMLLADQSFSQTFQDIFGGGEACLKLERGKERLQSGIDIEVKLPGKKSQALNLLSGGERALTCIAFIFALLRLKPAPFCILDEIDASLDETNLIRFSKFMKKMAMEMQYIIITHRQSTIEAGENIYGVTMAEKGVSKVLTLNVNDSESMAV